MKLNEEEISVKKSFYKNFAIIFPAFFSTFLFNIKEWVWSAVTSGQMMENL